MLDARPTPTASVLLAEDNRVNQMVAKAMLENLGFSVDVVADGEAAVKAAARTSYAAILMDCQIPVLDGYEATREIRRLHGPTRHTPIIAVTASVTHANRQRCLAAGMDDYLSKPLALNHLSTAMARWVTGGMGRPGAENDAPGTGPTGDRPVLDAEIVTRLERLGESAGEDLMGQLAVLFLASADHRVLELRDAVITHDAGAAEHAAHTLRGASANVGATDLAGLAAMMETHAATGSLPRGAAILGAIETELARVRVGLEAWAAPAIEPA